MPTFGDLSVGWDPGGVAQRAALRIAQRAKAQRLKLRRLNGRKRRRTAALKPFRELAACLLAAGMKTEAGMVVRLPRPPSKSATSTAASPPKSKSPGGA